GARGHGRGAAALRQEPRACCDAWAGAHRSGRPAHSGDLMIDISMPRLSDSMEEGTILKWLDGEGAQIKRGDELAEIETDKASMVYEADEEGALHILAGEGDTLPVGAPIAQLLAA